VTNAQSVYRLLTTLGVWLPIVTLALFIGGIALARDSRRALTRGALGVTAGMLVLGVVLALVRSWYVSTTPADILTEQAAGDVFDTLVRFLRTGLRAAAVLGLVLALGAFLAGPASVAVRTRATLQGGIGTARAGARTKGWDTGAFGAAMYAHRRGVRIGVLVAAGVVLAFWTRPSAWVVVAVAAVALLLLAVAEFLSSPPHAAGLVPAPSAAAPEPPSDTSVPRQAQRAVELPADEPRPQPPTPAAGASGQRSRPE
jgi:hypothetical protein